MRILVTGGAGKAGRHVIAYLIACGHRVLNVDLAPCAVPGVFNRIDDITDAGHMHDVMCSYADFDALGMGQGMSGFDAVIHFAAIARIMIVPDCECYRVNTIGTYNVIDAAIRAGVKKVLFPSCETTYGICFSDVNRQPDYLPLDEDHPTLPEGSYAMSKVANEVAAKSFQRRSGIDIYGLRLNNVIAPKNTPKGSQISLRIRHSVCGTSSATSKPAIWAISSTAPWPRMAWAMRCSTSQVPGIRLI